MTPVAVYNYMARSSYPVSMYNYESFWLELVDLYTLIAISVSYGFNMSPNYSES